jgi:hypothetical protein
LPEALYSYKPTPDVRTFGELFGHIAGSQKMYCAMALGDKVPGEGDVEKAAKTKAALVAALKESNTYCEKAYTLQDDKLKAPVDVFGETHPRLYALLANAAHNGEHYGNIVTYMRLNKLVPPSSRRDPAVIETGGCHDQEASGRQVPAVLAQEEPENRQATQSRHLRQSSGRRKARARGQGFKHRG